MSNTTESEAVWEDLTAKLSEHFKGDMDVQGILFVIGLQELGKSHKKYSKDQKLEIIHIAICTLLEPYGYYKFEGLDEEGWPHWEIIKKLPSLKASQQNKVMKEAIIEYFKKMDFI